MVLEFVVDQEERFEDVRVDPVCDQVAHSVRWDKGDDLVCLELGELDALVELHVLHLHGFLGVHGGRGGGGLRARRQPADRVEAAVDELVVQA